VSPADAADAAILVVEDDRAMLRTIAAAFEARGQAPRLATTGREALELANREPPDVVLLDLGLPDIDGVEICRRLRRWHSCPIIVLTADGAEERKVAALDEGADDYVTKPFSMPELQARVRVALRHRAALAAIVDGQRLRVGTLEIDTAAYVASVDGETLELRRREFELLTELARNADRVLTSRHLLTQVWGSDWAKHHGALRTLVSGLRRKLGSAPGTPHIKTASGIGYRLCEPEGNIAET
jgi:two-component system KDP operon response regulator KdpE